MTTRLSAGTLAEIARTAAVPAYKAADLTPGIVHFGIGNFHRAHQAVYLDSLFAQGRDHDWAILGAGVMPSDQRMRDALEPQDWLTTVVEQSGAQSLARVTGAMVGMLPTGDADPSGCVFHPRCTLGDGRCRTHEPPLVPISNPRKVACHAVRPDAG